MIWFIAMIACQSEIDNKPSANVQETKQEVSTKSMPSKDAPSTKPSAKIPGALSLDASSKVEWVGAKVTGDHTGGFKVVQGSAVVKDGVLSQITAEIDINSIFSDNAKLTKHLLNKDFFEVASFPKAIFTSSKIEEGNIQGTLDMKSIKKDISFPAKISVTPQAVDIQAEFTINRRLWNINYDGRANNLIKDNVLIKLDVHYK